MKRRKAIGSLAAGLTGITVSSCNAKSNLLSQDFSSNRDKLKGNINHSACRWCYSKIPLEELAEAAQELGLKSIELLDPDQWGIVARYNLECGISNGSPLGITKGFNDPSLHDKLRNDYRTLIPKAAEAGIKQIICFSGNRRAGITEEDGIEYCAEGLDPIVKEAAKYGITIVMELLNSKVDHAHYQCDHTPWGAALVDKIGSPNFKLLYDIYHMQIMEGDVIATITKYKDYISHFHTGGVPGRNEIDMTQELNYDAIMKAILATGFDGYVAQEFIPTRQDALDSLSKCMLICDV